MTPEIRALADRFILDSANLQYLASCVPKGGLERAVEGDGRTVRQLIHHLGSFTMGAAEALERVVGGDELLPKGFTPEDFNRRAARSGASMPLPEALALAEAALNRMLRALETVPAGLEGQSFGKRTLAELVTDWSLHYVRHGIDLADSLPELRFDPMILNWILYADYTADARRTARQVALLAEVRERFAGDDEEKAGEDES